MDIDQLTLSSLAQLHACIAKALADDDARPFTGRQFRVRETPDWRRQAEAFERVMTRKGVAHTPICW